MHRTASSGLAAALLVLAACGGEDSGPATTTVVDSAGVQLVSNAGAGAWTEDTAWGLEEIFRVGGIDAGEDARFGQIMAVDVGADGRVYAGDQQAREVRVFEADGSFVGTVGSAGEGPGELGQLFMGLFERDGELWTIDPANQGIQRFDAEGDFIGAIRFDVAEGFPVRLDEFDRAILAQRVGISETGIEREFGDAVTTLDTESPDTLVILPAGQTITMEGGEPQVLLFAPEPVWDVSDDGMIARAMTDAYRVEVLSSSGDLVRVVSRELEPQPVTPAVREGVFDAIADRAAEFGVPREVALAGVGEIPFAEYVPMLVQLILEPNGTLWVQRTGDIREAALQPGFNIQQLGSPTWDVFDPEGSYLGRITIPGRFQPLRLIDGVLWGIDLDEFDVQSVVGMRVVR